MSTGTCDDYRIALSARLDGEDPGTGEAGLDGHLAGCAGCRAWLSVAEQVTRTVRVQSVAVPDLTAAILTAVAADEASARRQVLAQAAGRRRILRIALAVSAAVQLVLAIPALLAGLGVTGVIDPHTSREAASFDIALAVGFALAAWRPDRARAFVPVAFVLAACLTLTSAFDIAGGATLLAHEMGHVAALAQAGLLWALSRDSERSGRPAAAAPVTVAR